MEIHHSPRVVRVTTLKDFCTEVPARAGTDGSRTVVRLLNRQTDSQHSATLLLSLQGLNDAGEVIWLCDARTISWLQGRPFGKIAESAFAAMRDLESIVQQHLESLGYDVRTSDYGLPDAIKPLAAEFECAKWVRVSEHEFKVRATTQPAGQCQA